MANTPQSNGLAATMETGVPVGGLGFGIEDVDEKAADGYQILHLGSTTGALQTVVEEWLDGFEGGD